MNDEKTQVLLVSSQPSVARLIARMCLNIGCEAVSTAASSADMMTALDQSRFEVVLIDENVDADPNVLLEHVRTSRGGRGSRTLLLTTAMTKSGVVKAAQAGVDGILLKPFSALDLKSRMLASQRQHRLAS